MLNPLTKKERLWLSQLESIMQQCPSDRLACYTIGDKELYFYDKHVAEAWEAENPNASVDASILHDRAGSALGSVVGNFYIDSCAG